MISAIPSPVKKVRMQIQMEILQRVEYSYQKQVQQHLVFAVMETRTTCKRDQKTI